MHPEGVKLFSRTVLYRIYMEFLIPLTFGAERGPQAEPRRGGGGGQEEEAAGQLGGQEEEGGLGDS